MSQLGGASEKRSDRGGQEARGLPEEKVGGAHAPFLSIVVASPAGGFAPAPARPDGRRRREGHVPSAAPLPTLNLLDIDSCATSIADLGGLTDTERRILVPLLRGRQNEEIAIEVGASRRAVKFHVSNILRKLRISQRCELIRFLF